MNPSILKQRSGSNLQELVSEKRHKQKGRLSADRPNLLKAFILGTFLHFRVQGIVSIFGYTYRHKYRQISNQDFFEYILYGVLPEIRSW